MARKTEEKKTQKSTNEVKTTSHNLIPEDAKDDVTSEEQTAVQSIETQTKSGNSLTSKGQKVKLRNPNTQYVDSLNGWTLSGEEEKELPEFPSQDLLERIKAGFIVKI